MIKVTIGALSDQRLQLALSKLRDVQVDTKLAYRFKKLADAMDVTMNKVRNSYTEEVVNKFAKLDENKKLTPAKTPWGFELKEGVDQKEFDAANDEFHKREVTIERPPLNIVELTSVKLSASELTALGAFFSDPEETVGDNVAQLRR